MADARSKAVLSRLADLSSRANYLIDKVTNLREPLAKGDSIDVPSIANLTVGSDGGSDVSAQSITTSVLTLSANLHPMINAEIPAVASTQLLDGAWADQVALEAMKQLKNSMDENLARDYLARTLAWTTGTAATYHDNIAGDALNEDDILNAQANLLANDGCDPNNLALFVHPFGQGSIMSIAGFVPNFGMAERGMLGIPMVGSVFGIPVFVTNSVLRNHTAATTAVTVATNVATATVASGHGFVAGQYITTSGHTTNASTPVAITSTTATTIVYPLTACDGALADGTGTITETRQGQSAGEGSCWNLMMDLSHVFAAQQRLPTIRIVPQLVRTSDNLQCSSIWGRIGRAARARVLHSPGSFVS